MEVLALRKELEEYLKTADVRLLKVLKAVVESYNDDDTVAYNIAGEPLNRKAYKEELEAAEREIKDGEIISQEDLEDEAKDW
ncbi:MAG: hypothetical protein ACQEWD_13610 [Bacteroidota bacterium]